MKYVLIAVVIIALVAGAALLVRSAVLHSRLEIQVESDFIYALTLSQEESVSQLLKIDSRSRDILAKVELAGPATKVREGNHIYVSSSESIAVYDKNLNELAVHERAIIDFDVNDSYLYALGDNALDIISFADPNDPSIVSSLSFDKTGHDIVFQDNKLYILDNILWPIYLYLVDVRDSERPELFELEIMGVNVHLTAQEVTDKWFVIEGYTVLSARGAILHVYHLTPPVERISTIALSEYCRLRKRLVSGIDIGLVGDMVSVGNYLYLSKLDIAVPGFWGDARITRCNLELIVLELRDLESVRQCSRLRLERRKDFDWGLRPPLVKDGDLLYYGGREGIWLVDIRNPARPSRAGVIETDYPVVSLELSINK